MHILTVIRTYLGITQSTLAKATKLMQADISEIENHPPQGRIHKYRRISDYLGIPVDALVKNDFRGIPEDFFLRHPVSPVYTPAPKQEDLLLGRMGEEFIFHREQERLAAQYPALSKLVLPFYKMKKDNFPGYDILSFDDNGIPYFLEVKTSLQGTGHFRITNNEMDAAQRLTAAQERYVICYISNWGTPDQQVCDIPFADLNATHQITPNNYICSPHPKSKGAPVTGICHFRQLRELLQSEAAEQIGIMQHKWSLYETGERLPPVSVYLKMSNLLDATIDELMDTYPAPQSNKLPLQ